MTTPRWTPGIERVLEGMRTTEGWELVDPPYMRVRRKLDDGTICCPITSLVGAVEDDWEDIAVQHDIEWEVAHAIVMTADHESDESDYDPALRAAMLEAGRITDSATAAAHNSSPDS